MWSHVRYLVALEYKRLRFAYLFCFWFTLFYGWLISQIAVIVHDPATDSSRFSIAWNSVTLDCFFLLVVPTISFLLQRKMFGLYWRTDMYSLNLQYMKRFPIHRSGLCLDLAELRTGGWRIVCLLGKYG